MDQIEKSMSIGSHEHHEISSEKFEEKFLNMINLMADARSVEIRLRIYFEIIKHQNQLRDLDFFKYQRSRFTVNRKKFHKILKELSLQEFAKYDLIREILDALAHADYLKAREKIKDYVSEFDKTKTFSEKKYPERIVDKLLDENNNLVKYAYLLDTSDQNLIIEEYQVFKHQGYEAYAKELISEILSSLQKAKKIGWMYEVLSMSRAIKRGTKVNLD